MKRILFFSCSALLIFTISNAFAGRHANQSASTQVRARSTTTESSRPVVNRRAISARNFNGAGNWNTSRGLNASRYSNRSANWNASRNWNRHWRRYDHDHDRVIFVGSFGYPFYPFGYSYYDYYPYSYYPYSSSYPVSVEASYYSNAQPVYNNNSYARGGRGSIVLEVQRRLAREGFYKGSLDGVMGSRTHWAIRAFERSHGLRVDGEIDDQLLQTMGLG